MSAHKPDNDRDLYFEIPKSIEYLPDGSIDLHSNITIYSDTDADPENARESIADSHGIPPENVTISKFNGKPYDGVQNSRPKGRVSVSFLASRWNVSWDPSKKQSNPNLN